MRPLDWQMGFWAAMDRHMKLDFVWGERDCVLFAADIADSITLDGRYVERACAAFDWDGIMSATKLLSGTTLRALVETVLGPAVPWVQCCHGDIVLVIDEDGRECLTVHDGTQLIGPRPNNIGVQAVPFRYAQCGWRIL